MKMSFKFVFAVLIVSVASVSCRPFEEEQQFDCSGLPDGYHSVPGDLKTFYSCSEGTLLARIVCEEGFAFNGIDTCAPEPKNFDDTEDNDDNSPDEGNGEENPPDEGNGEENPPEGGNGESENDHNEMSKRKVINIEITKNIFPKSILIIGKLNREQKNK